MTERPSFDPRISMGNIITLIGMLAGISIGWGAMNARMDTALERIDRNATVGVSNEARIRTLENSAARQDEKLILILESLREIKQTLKTTR